MLWGGSELSSLSAEGAFCWYTRLNVERLGSVWYILGPESKSRCNRIQMMMYMFLEDLILGERVCDPFYLYL